MTPAVKKTIITVGILTSLSAIAYGIYLFYKKQVARALQYCYKVADISIYHVRKDSISFALTVKVQNKSDFKLLINGYDLDIIMNERKIANVKSIKQYTIYPASISSIQLEINFDPSKVFDKDYLATLLSYMITDQSKIALQITGTLNVSMDFINLKKLKFDYLTTVQKIVNTPPDSNVKCDIT